MRSIACNEPLAPAEFSPVGASGGPDILSDRAIRAITALPNGNRARHRSRGFAAPLPSKSGSLAMLAAIRRAASLACGLFGTHQPQELGFVNVTVIDEAGD